MNQGNNTGDIRLIYFRLVALWVICEAMIGGIIHGLRIPVSGLIVGSCAVICISLIAYYNHSKGAILKATLIVAIFKMMLSPQSPPPAYLAVFFQGFMGEILFWNRRLYPVSCILLGVLALLESGLQRILVLTIIYGNDLWRSLNDFISGLAKQKKGPNYSFYIGSVYVLLHLSAGMITGWWASVLPKRIEQWKKEKVQVLVDDTQTTNKPSVKRRRRIKKGLLIIWIILVLLYVQSWFKIGTPLLPANISLRILIRSLIIVFSWYFLVGPLLQKALHSWLKNKQVHSQAEIQNVLALLPSTEALIRSAWKQTAGKKGLGRIREWSKQVMVNALANSRSSEKTDTIYILSGPVQTGKTSSLQQWAGKREDVYGILTPVVEGKRVFMNAHTGEQWPMEVNGSREEVLVVGKYIFSKTGFDKAIEIVRVSIQTPGWLVIDEVGPLELRLEGFSQVLKSALGKRRGKTILVIRDNNDMILEIKKVFGIENSTLLHSTESLVDD